MSPNIKLLYMARSSRLAFALLAFCAYWPALALSADTPPRPAAYADRILIKKSARKLFLIQNNRLVDDFTISLGTDPIGPKEHAGDRRTPEGTYIINWKNPDSHYFLSLHLSYPNAEDEARAARQGVNPGDNIMIHGLPNDPRHAPTYYRNRDWTHGCIAVSDQAMTTLWQHVQPGTIVQIEP